MKKARPVERKNLTVSVKSVDVESRTFSGLAAAYALDLGGDIIQKGAFARTLADFAASQRKLIYLVDSHNYGSIRSILGKMTVGEETDNGLLTEFLLVDGVDGDETLRRLEGGFIDSMSIGFQVINSRAPTDEEKIAGARRVLTEIKLVEVSLVVFPMNPAALVGAKGLTHGLPDTIDADEVEEWKSCRDHIDALLLAAKAGGLASEDPGRIAAEEIVRDLELRRLGAA